MNAITNVAQFRQAALDRTAGSLPVSAELEALQQVVEAACPPSSIVSFVFDGNLRVAVDVHTFEEASQVADALPSLAGGVFHDVSRGNTPGMSFRRRVSALVDR